MRKQKCPPSPLRYEGLRAGIATMVTPYVTSDGAQVLLPDRELIGDIVAQFLGQK